MALDFTPGIYHGPLVEVVEDEGTGLVGDHAAGVTVLTVGSGGAFDLSGSCDVAGNVYAFTRDGETLSITPALVAAADDGDPVTSLGLDGRPDTRTQAIVDLDLTGDEDEELPRAWIPGEWSGFYPLGTGSAGAIIDVTDTPDGYRVVGRPHDAPAFDGSVIDPATLPSSGSGQTFADTPPPDLNDTTGFAEGHVWWQVVDGAAEATWRAEGGVWVPLELVKGETAYFQNALIEALQVTGLTAVRFEGGSIAVAITDGAAHVEPFTGTSLPTGWVADNDLSGYVAPAPSVVNTGPTGIDGSALLLDTGASGQTTGTADQIVTTDYTVADFHALIRFQADVKDISFSAHSLNIDFAVGTDGAYRLGLNINPFFSGGSYGASVGLLSPGGFVSETIVNATVGSSDFVAGAWYKARVKKLGSGISLTVWDESDPEPGAQTGQTNVALPAGDVRIWASSHPDGDSPSQGQRYFIDQFDVTAIDTGFQVNPDGTGAWPAIGIAPGDPAWHEVGTAGEPAFENGWTAQDPEGLRFRKTPTGDVIVRGRVTGGSTNATCFTLPTGYRPDADIRAAVLGIDNNGVCNATFWADGRVQLNATSTAAWVSINYAFSVST